MFFYMFSTTESVILSKPVQKHVRKVIHVCNLRIFVHFAHTDLSNLRTSTRARMRATSSARGGCVPAVRHAAEP